jgi:hypothetical protein
MDAMMDFSVVWLSVFQDFSCAGRCPDVNGRRSSTGEGVICKLLVIKAVGNTCGGSQDFIQC